MTMNMTRKGFLGAATSGTVLLLLQACGGGGDSSPASSTPPPSGPLSCGSTGAAIASNHGHSVTIAAADLDSATDRSYNIGGTSNHSHTITLTAAQLSALKSGQSVTVTSSTDSSHNHAVTITCA